MPEIVALGISSLKIEGRYKDADYVALATRAYRKAVDEAAAGREPQIEPAEEIQLEQVYSRGLGAHFLSGTNHQTVVQGRAPRHRGVLIGRVVKVVSDAAVIEPADVHRIAPVKPGDGIVFDAASWSSPQDAEQGGRIYAVSQQRDGTLILRFGNRAVDFGRVREGDLVWRTHDPSLDKVVRPYLEAATPVAKQAVNIRVQATEGAPLATWWRVGDIEVEVTSDAPLGSAANRALAEDFLREQFSRLGNTPYVLTGIELDVKGSPFAPASVLNQIRREAVARLQERQSTIQRGEVRPPESRLQAALERRARNDAGSTISQLHLLVRTPEQLEAAIKARPFQHHFGLPGSVWPEAFRSATEGFGITPRVATPRVLKPGEERVTEFLVRLECPLLVRPTGLVDALAEERDRR